MIGVVTTLFFTAKAARAALLNARAVINAERPHLIFDNAALKDLYPNKQAPLGERLYGVDQPKAVTAQVCLINQGKTPCEIIRAAFLLVAEPLPDAPDYGEYSTLRGVWITAGGSYNAQIGCRPEMLEPGRRSRILQGEWPLFLMGHVEYRSVFEERHESRFAYRFDPQRLTQDGAGWMPEDQPGYWKTS